VAGLAARSFAPWIAPLLSTIRPQALPVSATSLATLPQLTAGGGPAVRVRLLCLSLHPYALNPRFIGPLFDSDSHVSDCSAVPAGAGGAAAGAGAGTY